MIVNSVVTAQKRYYEIKAFENSLNRKRDISNCYHISTCHRHFNGIHFPTKD